MGNNQITTTERGGLTVAQVGGNDIYKMLPQVREIVRRSGLGDDCVTLFAEPVDGGKMIDWYADQPGRPQRVNALPDAEKQRVLQRFRDLYARLNTYAESLAAEGQSQTYKNYAEILKKALVMPDLNDLYAVDGKPVMTAWGFTRGGNETSEGGASLIRQIEKSISEAEQALAISQQAVPEEPDPEPEPEPTALAAADESAPEAEKASASTVAPSAPAQPAKSQARSRLWLWILLAALCLALILWYFLSRDEKPQPDMAFLQGEITLPRLLANESAEAVDVRLSFPSDDGRGSAVVIEQGQQCTGSVQAQPGQGNSIYFSFGRLACPNKDDYEPFSLLCQRDRPLCKGTGNNGETWDLQIDIMQYHQR